MFIAKLLNVDLHMALYAIKNMLANRALNIFCNWEEENELCSHEHSNLR